MKKIVLCIGVMLFFTACSGNAENVRCKIGGKDAVFTLKDGMVSSYTLDGTKMSQSTIDNINGEYFTSSDNNEEGKEAVKTYVENVHGSCE